MELGIVIDDSRTSFIDLSFTRRGMGARLPSGRTWSVGDLQKVIAAMESPRWIRAVAEHEATQPERAHGRGEGWLGPSLPPLETPPEPR
jgi:hypothetical protein